MSKEIKITYKIIASMINKSESNIKFMKKNNPELLEIIKLGCIEKIKLDRSIEKIKSLLDIKSLSDFSQKELKIMKNDLLELEKKFPDSKEIKENLSLIKKL